MAQVLTSYPRPGGLTCVSCAHFRAVVVLPGGKREVHCAAYESIVGLREIRSCPRVSYEPGVDEGYFDE